MSGESTDSESATPFSDERPRPRSRSLLRHVRSTWMARTLVRQRSDTGKRRSIIEKQNSFDHQIEVKPSRNVRTSNEKPVAYSHRLSLFSHFVTHQKYRRTTNKNNDEETSLLDNPSLTTVSTRFPLPFLRLAPLITPLIDKKRLLVSVSAVRTKTHV